MFKNLMAGYQKELDKRDSWIDELEAAGEARDAIIASLVQRIDELEDRELDRGLSGLFRRYPRLSAALATGAVLAVALSALIYSFNGLSI